ncbi:MAG: SDR family oxidoreductase [Gammaproteobacteria bacterium]|nr:SDR family oxidoreductase [Gammaproteobacteria bacterium]MCP5199898.1 SDR family oxidoreductase [Gammaproteobacteria bacterium]
MRLNEQTVVVLGGTSGIGLATACAARDAGARVVVTGRDAERLERARATLGDGARVQRLDATDEAGTRTLCEELGSIHHVFVTAGQLVLDGRLAPATDELRPALDTRFWAALYAAKFAAPHMPAGGSITFMSGTAGRRPLPGAAVASASCGAVDAFARALALDLAPIRVNTITPGYVDTPLFDDILGAARDQVLADAAARLPVGRIGQPEDIAHAVLFLMQNGYVTGINLVVDGGGLLV